MLHNIGRKPGMILIAVPAKRLPRVLTPATGLLVEPADRNQYALLPVSVPPPSSLSARRPVPS